MPKIYTPSPEYVPHLVDMLAHGGVIVVPTETAYGLAVDATNKRAVEKIYQIKNREDKPLSIAVANMETAEKYGSFSPDAQKIAQAFLPGPLTMVVPRKMPLPHQKDTVGIRIPNHPWLCSLLASFEKPLTATSANMSGAGPCYSIDAVQESLGEHWNMIDAVVDAGHIPEAPVSTVVDCISTTPVILRTGPISGADIAKVLG